MSVYSCEYCKREFNRKDHLIYHITNKVCLKKDFNCRYCPSKFTSKVAMYTHMRDVCKIKKQNDKEKEDILERLMKLEEDNKRLAQLEEDNKRLIKLEEDNKKQQKATKKLEADNKKLKEENKKMKTCMRRVIKTTDKSSDINNKITNNSINNGIVNNGTFNNNNIILVGYGSEDLSKLSKLDMLKVLQSGYNSTVKLTEVVHFNPDFPEYHNVYISNMKDKYAMMHDGNKWTLTTKEDLISKIYDDKKNYIEENLEAFVESLHPFRKRALERWLDTDDEDTKVKEIKENIKLLLYNSKNMIIDSKEPVKLKSVKVVQSSNNSSSNKVIKEKSIKVRKNI
jgi:hypothetical protein